MQSASADPFTFAEAGFYSRASSGASSGAFSSVASSVATSSSLGVATSSSLGSAISGSLAASLPAAIPGYKLGTVSAEIAKALGIEAAQTSRTRADMRFNYRKWLAVQNDQLRLNTLIADKIWTAAKPPTNDFIEVYFPKSTYHFYPNKLFPLVDQHPELLKWFMNTPDALPDTEIWGESNKQTYAQLSLLLGLAAEEETPRREKKVDRGDRKRDKSVRREDRDSIKKGKRKA